MFAIPDHKESVWADTLQKAVELNPEHISFYSLQLEEGTPYFEMFEKGEIKQITDDLDRKMYHKAIKFLNDAGYEHYEISNCAKSGFECKHNLKYWNMDNYLGLGLGSHSFVEGTRFSNTREITFYYEQFKEVEIDKVCVLDRHENTLEESVSEYIFTGMRRLNGIDLIDFEARFGKELFEFYPEKSSLVEKYMEQGYVIIENNRMRFTLKGIDISNTILSEFV
jgi:oxygen-independent coproporphyrinogen-3 oxidase